MTKDQILKACKEYRDYLENNDHVPVRIDPSINALDTKPNEIGNHLLFMVNEIPNLLEKYKIEKAMRWLGFVQCGMWMNGFCTISNLKDQNR